MPRGSKPGERRGGRQKGTPNKKTALRNAALSAAAADPNLSPLDYLLSVMGDDAPLSGKPALLQPAKPFRIFTPSHKRRLHVRDMDCPLRMTVAAEEASDLLKSGSSGRRAFG
jgi:hypothetical protein